MNAPRSLSRKLRTAATPPRTDRLLRLLANDRPLGHWIGAVTLSVLAGDRALRVPALMLSILIATVLFSAPLVFVVLSAFLYVSIIVRYGSLQTWERPRAGAEGQ
jgi:hypothetical protein